MKRIKLDKFAYLGLISYVQNNLNWVDLRDIICGKSEDNSYINFENTHFEALGDYQDVDFDKEYPVVGGIGISESEDVVILCFTEDYSERHWFKITDVTTSPKKLLKLEKI